MYGQTDGLIHTNQNIFILCTSTTSSPCHRSTRQHATQQESGFPLTAANVSLTKFDWIPLSD